MRTPLVLMAALVFLVSMCDRPACQAQPGTTKPGKGFSGIPGFRMPPVDPDLLFDALARGRSFFLLSEVLSKRIGEPLAQFAKDKGITDGKFDRPTFHQFLATPAGQAYLEGPAPAAATKCEYRVEYINIANLEGNEIAEKLQKLGAAGWELAAIDPGRDKQSASAYIFRRPLADKQKLAPEQEPKKAAAQLQMRTYTVNSVANTGELAKIIEHILEPNRYEMRVVGIGNNLLIVNGPAEAHEAVQALLRRIEEIVERANDKKSR